MQLSSSAPGWHIYLEFIDFFQPVMSSTAVSDTMDVNVVSNIVKTFSVVMRIIYFTQIIGIYNFFRI